MIEHQGEARESQLVIIRSSRLEVLVPQLMALLDQTRPDNVLAPQTVIAAHPGVKQWLAGALAREAGAGGVVANLDVVLPSTWLDQSVKRFLGGQAVALPAWQRRRLRWTIHDFLGSNEGLALLRDPRIAPYLQEGPSDSAADAATRRFQLADRLAQVYSQYMVYRADWLAAWEAGKARFATAQLTDTQLAQLEAGLLAPLWKHLSDSLGSHRAGVVNTLVAHLDGSNEALEPLHVFGLSHLPPGESAVLRAWARRVPVFLYLPDPCREYWGGLDARATAQGVARLAQWKAEEGRRIGGADGGEWLDDTQGHPLLARWGRLGQHFYAGLADWDAWKDIRDTNDREDSPGADLLGRLQHGIRALDPRLGDDAEPLSALLVPVNKEDKEERLRLAGRWFAARRGDASLRVHACHTRLRELEVLRDVLLKAVADGITPGDILVMAPDISAYAPLLPAVFGQAGDARERRLPWHLADAPIMRSHRLFATFARLLELGASRVTTPEVVDLLEVPEISLALGLDAANAETLVEWLRASRAAWGLDAQHRASFGVPPTDGHTLAWGLDRMVAGYVMSDAGAESSAVATHLPDGRVLLPVAGIHGPASTAVGALDRLLRELQHWQDLSVSRLSASEWSSVLERRLQALVEIDRGDSDARAAWSAILRMVATLGSEPREAGCDPELHFSVVRELLLDALASVPERQRFLMGGITFCGMVPQRAIPFAMICVLGLNDGEFPRSRRDGGIDLMARLRRVGDRDVRSDDRWLFLETLMSARRCLHLSYLGLDARDGKSRNPAAPLAELMSALDDAHGAQALAGEVGMKARPWLVQHALQPFADAYFRDEDPALFSHSAEYARMQAGGAGRLPPFLQGEPLQADALPDPVPLRALSRFWKAPAEYLLSKRLHLDLAGLGDGALSDSEPLDDKLPPISAAARRVFFGDALPMGAGPDGAPAWRRDVIPDWIAHSGLLPPGRLGEIAWENEANAVEALLAAAGPHRLLGHQGQSMAIELDLASLGQALRLKGQVDNVFSQLDDGDADGGQRLLVVRAFPKASEEVQEALKDAGKLGLGDLLPAFIDWAALRLQTAALSPPPAVRLCVLAKGTCALAAELEAWDQAFLEGRGRNEKLGDLARRLAVLVAHWQAASASPPMYFPSTSSQVLAAASSSKHKEASEHEQVTRLAANATAAFESTDFRTGERDYAPGWSRILARGIHFDPLDREGRSSAIGLLHYARELQMQMEGLAPETEGGWRDD